MFENIIGHKQIVSRLRTEVSNNTLPSSLLFCGPQFTGKLTTALELARVLNCEKDGDWKCPCSVCKDIRLLKTSNILLLGNNEYLSEINITAKLYKNNNKPSNKYKFVRAVRKFLLNIKHTALLKNDNSDKTLEDIDSIDNLLLSIEEFPHKYEGFVDDILKNISKIEKNLKANSINIKMIRSMIDWTYRTSSYKKKVVIIENAEELNNSSTNALLKTLEEPAKDVVLILIAKRRSNIKPTILSRLRIYNFLERSEDEDLKVMKIIFEYKDEKKEYNRLRDYLLQSRGVNLIKIKNLVIEYGQMLVSEDISSREQIQKISKELDNKNSCLLFFQELDKYLFSQFKRTSSLDLQRIEFYEKLIDMNKKYTKMLLEFNTNIAKIIESLYYDLDLSIRSFVNGE